MSIARRTSAPARPHDPAPSGRPLVRRGRGRRGGTLSWPRLAHQIGHGLGGGALGIGFVRRVARQSLCFGHSRADLGSLARNAPPASAPPGATSRRFVGSRASSKQRRAGAAGADVHSSLSPMAMRWAVKLGSIETYSQSVNSRVAQTPSRDRVDTQRTQPRGPWVTAMRSLRGSQ